MTASKHNLYNKDSVADLVTLLRGLAEMAWTTEYTNDYHDLVSATHTEQWATNVITAQVELPYYGLHTLGTKKELEAIAGGAITGTRMTAVFQVTTTVPYLRGCRCARIRTGIATTETDTVNMIRDAFSRAVNALPDSEVEVGHARIKSSVNPVSANISRAHCLFCI